MNQKHPVLAVQSAPEWTHIKASLEDEFDILLAEDGLEALKLVYQYEGKFSLIVIDLNLSGFSGMSMLNILHSAGWMDQIPVVIILDLEQSANKLRLASKLGVTDYITRPFDAEMIRMRIQNALDLFAHHQKQNLNCKDILLKYQDHSSSIEFLIHNYWICFENCETGLHLQHLRFLSELLLLELINEDPAYATYIADVHIISAASAFHDIGKTVIDPDILNRTEPLTPQEQKIMESHTTLGAGMLEGYLKWDCPILQYGYQICHWHHERWDGNGYPDHFRKDQIPLAAQIVGLADAYDSWITKQGNPQISGHKQAMEAIRNGICGSFNPRLLACLETIEPFLAFWAETQADTLLQVPEKLHTEQSMDLEERLQAIKFPEVAFEYHRNEDTLYLGSQAQSVLNLPPVVKKASVNSDIQKTILSHSWLEIEDQTTQSSDDDFNTEIEVHTLSGDRWFHLIAKKYMDEEEDSDCLIGKLIDVHEVHQEQQEQAYRDPLTGLYNRRGLKYRLEKMLHDDPKLEFAVLLVDVDEFKAVNDSQGHLCGDQILRSLAELFQKNLRQSDISVRIGGDEFLLLLPCPSVMSARDLMNRIFQTCSQKTVPVPVSLSMGMAHSSQVPRAFKALFHAADLALYSVKKAGRNACALYHASMVQTLQMQQRTAQEYSANA